MGEEEGSTHQQREIVLLVYRREGGRKGGREGGREGWVFQNCVSRMESHYIGLGGKEGGREGGRGAFGCKKGGREGRREEGRDGGTVTSPIRVNRCCSD